MEALILKKTLCTPLIFDFTEQLTLSLWNVTLDWHVSVSTELRMGSNEVVPTTWTLF